MADSQLPGFLVGLVTGALSKVVADRVMDLWRRRDTRAAAAASFERIRAQMPALIDEMQRDLETHDLVREFFVLPTPENSVGFAGKRFTYYESQHPDLLGKLAILEEQQYIWDIRTHRYTPLFRMSGSFVDLLTSKRD